MINKGKNHGTSGKTKEKWKGHKDGKIEYTLQDAMNYYGINEGIYEIILEKGIGLEEFYKILMENYKKDLEKALIKYFNDIK